ncbi:Fructosamine/Ketosamine-3-kinase [Penicillium griseofulvum]|uniref:protein-ribulosamine 3-kinase n=1 Tax=Penicillium patulum TaxID=5078 RepID=A0A135LNI0_PENPA|nr:Fructosamine/Ketosamine-3-kinase [Penicillium griseofulvum]KXG50515.1 Fructosamine/Ketosamine-3-kinase [Penicillium griseofulvum]
MIFQPSLDSEVSNSSAKVDPAVAAKLPCGAKVVSTENHGFSFRATTGRIDVELVDGSPQRFFMKVLLEERGKAMVQGEYESMTAIYNIIPESVPKPIGWGTYETIPNTHFFLCEFKDIDQELPDVRKFTEDLAVLHKDSRSPTGKFGFHVTTYSGNLSQHTEWSDSWETFFAKSMRHALAHEISTRGPSEDVEILSPTIFDIVIPRLLRPLESEGRSVKPCLMHGDLWYGNTGKNAITKSPIMFDACSFYAHNEYELGQWAPVCNRFGTEYVQGYYSQLPISSPVEDYQGRIDLYKLRFNTHVSALFPQNLDLREQMLNDMRDLIARYGNISK